MNEILKRLSEGDLYSEGNAAEVANEIVKNPDLFLKILEGIKSEDAIC